MRTVAALAFILMCAGSATAQPARSDMLKARAHYNAGEAAYNAGDYDKAIAEYQATFDILPRPKLLFNLGSCYRRKAEKTGALADKKAALDFYQKYLDKEPKGEGATDAQGYVAKLGMEVEELERRDKAAREEREAQEARARAEREKAAEAARRRPPPPPPPPPAGSTAWKTWRIAGIITAGAGIALVAGGVYFGLKAQSASDDLSALESGGTWDPGLYDDGQAAERNMFILVGAGAAAVVGGAVMYFALGHAPSERTPVVGLGPDGLVVAGRF